MQCDKWFEKMGEENDKNENDDDPEDKVWLESIDNLVALDDIKVTATELHRLHLDAALVRLIF